MNKLIGIKNTPSRLSVLDILEKEHAPVDVAHIVGHVKSLDNKIDQATVYRILQTFENKGIIDKFEFGEGKSRYEIKREDHHHLVCDNCRGVTDIEDNVMHKWEKEIMKTKGFNIKKHNLEFFGLCKNCQN
jgi:Fur family ferric uptake transcriptional regulator